MYISNFNNYLGNLIKNKNVLDCGIAGDRDVSVNSPFWVHRIIHENARTTLGIDYDKVAVKKLKKLGYKCVYGDCHNFNFGQKFDVIFAGELIEHLENPGKFLVCAHKHLKKEGLLIITTPNQFSIVRFIGNLFGVLQENPEHVLIHNEKTITHLLERKGFKVIQVNYFITPSFYEIGRFKTIRKVAKMFLEIIFMIKQNLSHQIFVIATK
ncbi:MAG: class I SAM-dependent methyltransferase [Candidatus Micrarchaeia archaeon]